MNGHSGRGAAALVLIGLQNSFFHESGKNYYPESAEALPALQSLLERARKLRRPVIFAADCHRPGLSDFEAAKLPAHCIVDEFEVRPLESFSPQGPGEFLLPKRRLSAFQATDLDLMLRELQARTLVIGGVKTNLCVRATVQDGFSFGYRCHVVREAVSSDRQYLANASLEDVERYLGWVVSLDEGLGLLS